MPGDWVSQLIALAGTTVAAAFAIMWSRGSGAPPPPALVSGSTSRLPVRDESPRSVVRRRWPVIVAVGASVSVMSFARVVLMDVRESAPAPAVLTGAGPNVPLGATLVFRMDVTQSSQTGLNPSGSFNCSAAWSTQPQFDEQGPESHKYVRFPWTAGQNEDDPGNCEYTLPAGTYNDLYVRVVWRANAAWETNGGGGKHIWLQNGAGGTTNNNAPAFGTDGTYGLTAVVMNLFTPWLHATGDPHTPTGDWYDDEWVFTNLETNTSNGTVAIYVDDVAQTLSGSGSGVQFSQSGNGINIIKIGPWHGGSGAKSTSNDYIDYKLVEVWKFTGSPVPLPTVDSIRWDTRAGGSHGIQSSTDMTDAIADAGYSGNSSCTVYHDGGTPSGCPRNIEFTLDYDGLGTNAFIYGYTDTTEFGSLDVEEQDFIWEVNATAMANMRAGPTGSTRIPLFYQWTTYPGRTASGGGGTGANGVFTNPLYSKRMVAYRDGGSQDCRFTLIGAKSGENNVRISWDGTYNAVPCGGEVSGDPYAFQVGRAYRWTVCLQSSSDNNVADGQVAVWVHDLSTGELTVVYNQTGINKGYKAINASVDIGAPTRTSAAWSGATPFYRQEVEYTYDHVAWQHMQHSSCSAAVAAWPGV